MRVGQLSAIDFISKAASSLLGFLATLYLARVLGASTLGTYYLILSVVGWLSLVGSMGVGGGLIKRISEKGPSAGYISAGAVIMIVFLAMTSTLLYVFRDQLNAYIGIPAFVFALVLLSVGIAGSFVDAVLQGQGLFHVYSFLKPIRRAIRSAVQVGAVIAGFGLGGLVAGYAFGGIIAVVLGLFFLTIRIELPRLEHFKSLLNYAKYSWLGQLKSQTFNQADILILGAFVLPSLVGVYSIAWNLAGFLSIFSASVSSALFPEVSNLSSRSDLSESTNVVNQALSYAGLITIPGLAGGLILGPNLLALYGSEFVRGASVLGLLIAATVLHDYQRVIVSALGAIDRPDLSFRVNGVLIISNVVLNLVLIFYFGWVGAAVATLTSAGLSLVVGYYILVRHLEVDLLFRQVGSQVISAVGMALVVLGSKRALSSAGFETNRATSVILLVLLGASVYGILMLTVSRRFRTTVLNNLEPLLSRLGFPP